MSLDQYSSCPCGSGKKFKWCCQPIYPAIERALEQDASGQHEAALRTIESVVKQHPGNPEVWGQKARLLWVNGKAEQADEALQKAFEINPRYPFGLLLRAEFRFQEGEVPGALLLARRAAEAYHPDARDQLASVSWLIFQCEDRLHRPVAARAALQTVLHYQPGSEEVRSAFDSLFGPESALPESARREYTYLSPPPASQGPRREAWNKALASAASGASTPKLPDVANAFEALTKEDPADSAAWYNLGLCKAWLGDNLAALDALDRYIELEADEQAAARGAALEEVLRLGAGMEDHADYHQYALACTLRDPAPVNALLQEWMQARRMLPVQTEQANVFFAVLLETNTASVVTVGRPASDFGRLAGYLTIAGNVFQITSPVKEPFDRLRDEVRQRLHLGLGELQERRGPGSFREVLGEAVIYPTAPGDKEAFRARALEHAQRFFEDTWIHRPRRSLDGVAPVDAVGSKRLRKKLLGVIQFVQECAKDGALAELDFDRLRRKLALGSATPTPAGEVPADITACGPAELAALSLKALSDEQLEQAYQTAHRLNAEELTSHFAKEAVARPARSEKPDRFPFFSYLIQKAVRDGELDAALDFVNEGQRQDCEGNEGRRRNDYELRRAQVQVKRGEADGAFSTFQSLIERVPANLRYRSEAAEAMLRLRQPAKALSFAEAGLEAARKQNDRDGEQQMMDLVAAAKKQGG